MKIMTPLRYFQASEWRPAGNQLMSPAENKAGAERLSGSAGDPLLTGQSAE